MYNYHNRKKFIYSIFLILLLVIGIGYAYLTSNLSISGNTQVTTNTWNIHFENLNVTEGSVTTSSPASINAAGDAITYTINLSRPKEYYEFTVDVKNDGTLPGKISVSSLSGLDTMSSKIIDYSVTYTNGNSVNVGDIINAGNIKSIKVRVFYKDEIDPTDFPATDLNLTLTYTLQYVQSEEDAPTANTIIEQLKEENSSCFTKYEGQVTDQPGQTVTASNVYFNKCADKRNIIFNNMCWQMIRTTETGGIKMIYNGTPVDDKCEGTRINNSNRDYIGLSQYNTSYSSLGMVGYMYNESIPLRQSSPYGSYRYGSTYTYANGTYTLSGTIQNISGWNNNYTQVSNTHYTCWNTTGTCSTISYIYYATEYTGSNNGAFYVNISGGKGINDLINDALYGDEVNNNNSIVKTYIDSWYENNLVNKTNLIEDTVYCNGRTINRLGGWNPEGGNVEQSVSFSNTSSLSCDKITDQFSITNNKAKLEYPIALITTEEIKNIDNGSLIKASNDYWTMNPSSILEELVSTRTMTTYGYVYNAELSSSMAVRPVISLASFNTISKGSGSEEDPWVVDD